MSAVHLSYLPTQAVMITSALLTVLAFVYLSAVMSYVRYTLQKQSSAGRNGRHRTIAEYSLITLLFPVLFISGLLPLQQYAVLFAAALWLWITLSFFRPSLPWFYALSAGFLIFTGSLAGIRLLGFAEHFWILRYAGSAYHSDEKIRLTWENYPDGKYLIYNFDKKLTEFRLPENFHFFPRIEKESGENAFLPWPVRGTEIFRIVSDNLYPDRPPVIIVWKLGTYTEKGEHTADFQIFLGYLRSRSGIKEVSLKDTGETFISEYGISFHYTAWTYRQQTGKQFRLSILEAGSSGNNWMILVNEEDPLGFPFSEKAGRFLNSLRFHETEAE